MKNLSTVLLEKLKISKDTKVIFEPKTIDDLLGFINNYLEQEFSIPEKEREIQISVSNDHYDIDIYFDKKYGDDSLYDKFTKLREAIRKTPYGGKHMSEAWTDDKRIRIHYKFDNK